MKRYTRFQKHLAMILVLVMLIGLMPTYTIAADGAGTGTDTRVVDPNTMNQWQDYFSAMSTEFAGGVWTDKSVMTDANAFSANITMDDPNNNFLVALSALAANQKIIGYTSTPMDVMLVLDVSGSMDSGSKDTAMIQAANQAIHSLLTKSENNRVGVVLYSGNSNTSQNAGTGTATVILPLDHYTTTSTTSAGGQTIPAYLNLSGSDNVSVASGVRNSSDQRVNTGSKNVSGGTYIQNGLYKAWNEFSQVTDVVVPAGKVQAGAQRTPIMVLMSDGQPTLATEDYNQVGTSQRTYGTGAERSTSWQTVFLTQLTASWIKGKMQAHYGTTPKFYTLGVGTGSSNYATAVLDPSNAYTTLNTYWERFLSNTPNANSEVNVGSNNNSWYIYKDSNVKAMDYVDQYWLAADADELLNAFQGIVDTIELSGAEHVTLVEDIGEDMSGYITFTDELGMFMEVKDMKGLVLGNTLFTGHELAESLQDGSLGTQQNPTEYGHEFIRTVMERLGIESVTDAQALVMAAYADGQLAYDPVTDEYSNYIGWYSNSAGDYLGFWDKDTGITAEGAPAGATWINKSYGYLGAAHSSDMMHVVVMVSTHIESGMQVVQYKIPASLIPTVTYEIELEGSDVTQMKSITRHEAFPLRLVYEIGLQDGINPVNVQRKLDEAHDAGWGHMHPEADGSYAFYTNLWGAEDGDASIDYNDPLSHQVAQSHFHPAVGNDRYYYTEDTPVYINNGSSYTLYSGTAAPAGSGFYRAYHYYTQATGYTTEYLPMSAYALQMAAANGRAADGYWYIPEGAVFQQIDRFHMPKDPNATGTLEYYDYPVVVDIGDKYDVYAFLGNNGKITMTPAQGIKVSKTVTETVDGATDTFTFHITLSQAVANPTVTDADGNAFTGAWSVNGNVITVALKADQTVYITGLPTGVTYTVEEQANSDYNASSSNATGTVEQGAIKAVDFVNAPKGYGNLIVSKDVDHPFTNVPAALLSKEFTIHVTLSGPDTANKQFQIAGTSDFVTTDANGTFTVKLKDNGSLTVVGLPEGTTFTTTETLDAAEHKGFSMDAGRSVLSGTIVRDTTAQTHVVNVYAPAPAPEVINVSGTKTLVDETGTFDWTGKSFTIRLEHYDPSTGTYTTVDETTVTDGALRFNFADKLKFDTIGIYYYKISEVIPDQRLEGMSYDATVGRFEVVVTDNDVDGVLELAVRDVDTLQQLTATDNVFTYEKNFVNTHTADATFVEFTVTKDVVDPHNVGVTGAGFLFELFEVVGGQVSATPTYSMRTVLAGSMDGNATFHIPVTKVGTQTFILRESAPPADERVPGMIYDTSEYTVTVTGSANNGKLEASVTFQKNGAAVPADQLVFTNTMDLTPLVIKPQVNKVLNGREPLNDSEFSFTVVQTDGSFATPIPGGYTDTVSVGKGVKHFKDLSIPMVGTYYFRVTETAGNAGGMTYDSSIYHVTMDVTFENGQLVHSTTFQKVGQGAPATTADSVVFTNTYVNNDTADLVLQGTKKLTGRTLIAGEFRFQLSQGSTVLQTVTNRADGSFVFQPITYTAADVGTHTYTVTELSDGKGGVTYDRSTYTVTVTVTDNGDGTLSVSAPTYTKGGASANAVAFQNTYAAAPTSVTFGGTKTWRNTDLEQDKTLDSGKFIFVLYSANADYTVQGAEVARTTNAAGGSFGFVLDYTAPGTYYYQLRELVADDPTVSYDTGVYNVEVSVYDNGVGQLVGSVTRLYKVGTGASTVAFTNYYTPLSTDLVLQGVKELTGHEPMDGEFQFQLFAADAQFSPTGEALQTVSNLADAGVHKFTFQPLPFTKSGTYYYVVKEVVPTQADINNVYNGITYDTTVFGITVTVTDDNGQLKATYTVVDAANSNAAQLKFTNTYNITTFGEFDLTGSKVLTDASGAPISLGGRVFTFGLYDPSGVRIATATSDATGSFTFRGITVTEAREYNFTVREINDGQGGIGYDAKEYTVTVNASDNGSGGLNVSAPVVKLSGNTAQLKFTNTYTLEKTTAQFRVLKVLENKTLTDGMFTFQLAQNGTVIQTKGNLLGGGVVFEPIEYTAPGDYTYTIVEINDGKGGITYDNHTVTVKVSVGDNGDGTMTADVTYEGLRQFTNTYSVTGDPKFSLSGTKELTGRDLKDGEFTFVLTDSAGNEVTTVTNTGKSFSFTDVQLPGLGTHTFTVTEKNTGKGGVTYDAREYKVSVTVSDNGVGGMTVGAPLVTYHGVAAPLTFSNTYAAAPTKHTITATKSYDKTLTGGEFEFVLSGMGENQTKTNAAGGAITFDELTFNEAGTYTYTVTEKAGDKSYITYDDTVYTVVIQVKDDLLGQLHVESVTVSDNKNSGSNSVVFDNAYVITGEPVFTVSGTKELTGRDLVSGEFTFILTDSAGKTTEVTNVGKYFSFANVKLPGLGTHTFTVTEKNTGVSTITYDASVYTVTVTVVDNNEGGMTVQTPVITLASQAAELTFRNVYTEPTPVTVNVNITKAVQGNLSPKGFKFELVCDGKVIATVETDDNGKAVLPLTFTMQDVGNHEFVLREVNTGVKYVTYDATEYKLLIGVADNGKGQLTTAVKLGDATVDAVNVTFTNKYNPPATPQTGDDSNPMLLMGIMAVSALAMVTLLAVLIIDRKKRTRQ